MSDCIFSGVAQVTIQGERVLTFLDFKKKKEEKYAEYNVIGFGDQIVIEDYRQSCLQALTQVLETGDKSSFAPQFNVPAFVTIETGPQGTFLIQLREPQEEVISLDHRLWIAVGIEDSIPVYQYVFQQIAPLKDDRYAFLSLYQREPT